MPNYTASHRTKPYFNIHGPDIIMSHNGNHCRVHPVMCLCQCRLRLDLASRSFILGRYLLCHACSFCVLTLTMRVAEPPYRRVLLQQSVIWFYCYTVQRSVCRCSAISHWWPLLPLFAGSFRCHFEQALTVPLAGLVNIYYHLCSMTHLLGAWCLFGCALLVFPASWADVFCNVPIC